MTTCDVLKFGGKFHSALRFEDVDIPQGATIVSAHLKVWPGTGKSNFVWLRYQAEASDDAARIPKQTGALTGRSLTASSVMEAPAAYAASQYNQTADFAPVVQEVIDRPGWARGNALQVMVMDAVEELTPTRAIKSYDSGPSKAPILVIGYVP